MDKKNIKKHLTSTFLSEDKKPIGLSSTEKIQADSKKFNTANQKEVAKEMEGYEKSLEKETEPVKYENSDSDKEYHEEMETMNGLEMNRFQNEPNDTFKERAEEAISGSVRMGNSPDYANVVTADQAGFTGPDFGKNLVKKIKSSTSKRDKASELSNKNKTSVNGTDFKDSGMNNKSPKSTAIAENKINKKSKMKRLIFKKEFKGVGNALNLIPETYKVNGKQFHMTDGNEKYEIRWEGSLTEGRAIVLKASDKNLMNEDMENMKRLMGYKSQDTLGTVKGSARLDENKKFNDIWGKTKNLMTEMTGGYGFTGEGNLEGMDQDIDKSIRIYSVDGDSVEFAYYPHNETMYLSYDEFMQKHPDAIRQWTAKQGEEPMYEEFPDLTGDGKVTQADILKGRGVFEADANTFSGWADKTLGMESPGLPKSPQIKLRSKADAGKTSLTYYFELADKKGEDDRKGNLRMYITVGDEPRIQYKANNLDDDNVEAFINKRKDDFVRMFNFYVENFSKEEMGEKLHVGGGYEDKVTDEDIASIKNGISKLKSVNIEKS